MKRSILYISRKFPRLYGMLYLILFFLMIIAGAFLPYVYKELVYSAVYEKQEAFGVIEREICREEEIAVKRRTTTVYTYFFEIDGMEVSISPSTAREYSEGDTYDYYIYSWGDKTEAESKEYILWKGALGLLAVCIIFFVAISFMLIDTKEEDSAGKLEESELPKPINYEELSAKELYELCLSRKINVIEGKRNNREYLERCLRSDYSGREYQKGWREGQRRKSISSGRIIMVIVVIALISVICHYMKVVYHFIYLFT